MMREIASRPPTGCRPPDRVAALEQQIHHVAADEAGAAGDRWFVAASIRAPTGILISGVQLLERLTL